MPRNRSPIYTAGRQLRIDLRYQSLQGVGTGRFGTRNQNILGVGGPEQPPTIGGIDASPVGLVDTGTARPQPGQHFGNHRELAGIVALEA